MCELLGMSANVPTDICFSFTGLIQRGGVTGKHKDGWGIAFYENKGCRSFHDPNPSAHSPVSHFVKSYPIKSRIVISHIRQANHGRVCLENTHPFIRELWGKNWVFAHNGQLKEIKKWTLTHYHPVGTTDSEHAFCWLMSQIQQRFPQPPKNKKTLWRFIYQCCTQLQQLGVYNMLFSDSQYLYVFCSTKLCSITRRAPFGTAQLIDTEMIVDFQKETQANDVVTVVATQRLTEEENWECFQTGEFRVLKAGEVMWQKTNPV